MTLALVVASALLHAAWNALLKGAPDVRGATAAALVVAVATAGAAALLDPAPAFRDAAGLGWAIAAGVCEGAYFLALAAALRRAPLGVVYTVSRGGALLVVWPASALLLGEPATGRAAGGLAAVLAGLVLTGGPPRRDPGVGWAVVTAGAIAGYHLCYKQALSAGASPAPLFALSLATALPLVLVAAPGAARAARAAPARTGAIGLLMAGSFLLFLLALARGGAGAVLTLRNVSVVFAQGFAAARGERPSRAQLAGAALVALGAAAVG